MEPNQLTPAAQSAIVDSSGRRYKFWDYYTYEIDFSALASGTSATSTFNIQADSDFIWQKSICFADIATAAQTESTRIIPLATVLITDSGAGRQLMNAAVPLTSLFGMSGSLPFILPRPRVFRANSTVTIQVTNFDAAVTYNLRLSFVGQKAFW